MAIKLIALDLDGTLLSSDHLTVSDINLRAIEAAIERGIQVVLATGRTLYDIPQELRAHPGIRYAVTSNGAALIDLTEDRGLFSSSIPTETAMAVIGAAKTGNVYTEVYSDGKAYIDRSLRSGSLEESLLFLLFKLLPQRHETEDLTDFLSRHRDPVEKIELLTDDADEAAALAERLCALPVTVTTSGMNSVEVTNRNTCKARALEHLCGLLEIDAADVMAVGDSMNDAEMLAWAGISVAVENADEDLKKIADFMTDSNDLGGVASAIERFTK